ncbi:FliC/FljB family flagellin [Buttiauxella noackiae]|uniref:FliC/FljB family flagellin n=1 Tax=Buttiauxella noackiae TaxID=82992 RepID=UPI0035A62F4A
MAQVISTNSLSLLTQNNLNKSQSSLGTAIERLSSGLRINSAKDDAAGQAIANRFTANIKGLTQASRNANDGISIAQTTEGALSEINNNLQRVRELAVQATNGTNSQSDLDSIQGEITQRLSEIDRVSGQTQFNGVKVLASDNNTLKIQVGANDNETIDINLQEISSKTLGLDKLNVQSKSDITSKPVTLAGGGYTDGATIKTTNFSADAATAFAGGATGVTINGDVKFDDATGKYFADVTVAGNTSKNGTYEVSVDPTSQELSLVNTTPASAPVGSRDVTALQVAVTATPDLTTAKAALTAAKVPAADVGAATLVQVTLTDKNGKEVDGGYALKAGNDYYKVSYDGKGGAVTASTVSYKDGTGADQTAAIKLGGADGKTEVVSIGGKTYSATAAKGHDFQAKPELTEAVTEATANPLAQIDAALAKVDSFRSDLGAVQNRFDSAITNLGNTVNNLTSARSRIEDADYATEVSNMSRAQILQQAGTSVLAQANQVPQGVLSLLR